MLNMYVHMCVWVECRCAEREINKGRKKKRESEREREKKCEKERKT